MDPPASAEQAAVCVTGRDAHAFLQGQLTQDLALLGPAVLLRAALNTPQGRVIARPWVFERDGVTTLIVPAELGAPLVARLKRFVLRAQVELRLAGPEELALAPLSEALAPTGGHQRLTHGLSALGCGNRTLLAGPRAELDAWLATAARRPAAPGEWALACIRAGDPEIGAATSEHWVAQMLNLDLIGAISFSKGCYTGQEIIARTQHLGRIKRRTFRYRAAGAALRVPAVAEALLCGGAKVAEVVLAAAAADGVELLAVVNLAARDQPLASADGLRFEPAELPYGVP